MFLCRDCAGSQASSTLSEVVELGVIWSIVELHRSECRLRLQVHLVEAREGLEKVGQIEGVQAKVDAAGALTG